MDVVRADCTFFEKQVGELGMLITALGQIETRVAEFWTGTVHCTSLRFDLRPDMTLDFRTVDRMKARECLRKEKPFLLVGFSRCVSSSQLQKMGNGK